jgi:hypothetical protein
MKAYKHSLSFSGWPTMVGGASRIVGMWLIESEVRGMFGVHYPMWRSFGLFAYSGGEFLVFGDVVPGGDNIFDSGIRQFIASYVCVPSDFVQYCG